MKLGDFYEKAIASGMDNDPRGRAAVLIELEERRKAYDAMPPEEKEYFDLESLQNPYADSRILYGGVDREIHSVLAGIDIEVGEILLADNLRSKGRSIDMLLSHHPSGPALAGLYAVMHMQADILNLYGVPISIAEGLMDGRIKEVERKLMPANHARAVDAARILDIPFLCLHTAADNMVANHLQKVFDEQKPFFVSDVVDRLRELPEYRAAELQGAGPRIVLGSKKRKAGRVFIDMTGGTEGAKEIFEKLTNSGVSTIVGMHISEEHRKAAEKSHMNVVVAGHIASDNLGLNLLLDEIMKKDSVEIIECSGFRRFSRLPEKAE